MFGKTRLSIPALIVFTVAMSALPNRVDAQSNFDIEPPLQANLKSQQVLMSPDPAALPTFRFAVAELNADGKITVTVADPQQTLLASAAPTPADDPRMESYTEDVSQNYTVMVPYQEITDDGETITKHRTETRTRTVKVIRLRRRKLTPEQLKEIEAQEKKDKEESPIADVAKPETVEIPYTIPVPYSEVVDGKPVTKTRQVTRIRRVEVLRGTSKTEGKEVKDAYSVAKLKAFSVDGKAIESDDLKKRLADRTPVIIIPSKQAISPYFQALLKPDAIFLVCPD